MPKFNNHLYTLDYTVSGIPCKLAVVSCLIVPPWRGSAMNCPSDLDYYGYEEVDYVVLDRKGYVAEWLAKKMSDTDEEEAVSFIVSHANDKAKDDYCDYYDRYN